MPSIHVLSWRGELDISSKESIERQFAEMDAFEPGSITILDLTDVRYLDATFLAALWRAGRSVAEKCDGRIIRIVTPDLGMIWRIFQITAIDRIFERFDDVSSAGSAPVIRGDRDFRSRAS